jgi:hypothetical protein
VRIQPGPALAALSDAFTISAWVRRDGATANTYQSIVSRQCGAGPDESYNVALSGGHVLLFLMCGSAHMTLRAPNAAPDHTWIHVVATFDATSVRLYVDNVLFAIAPPDVPSIIHDDHPVLIGNNENGSDPDEPFQGRIDDVAIWNRALSAYQVGLLYNGADPLTL